MFGDSRPLVFMNREIYNSKEELRERVELLRGKEYALVN